MNEQQGDAFEPRLTEVQVARIRPESGLGRKRDRDGHRELQRSIQQFGVLTPITVRPAPDESGDFLLIKGQGRTLACRLLGVATIPAIVVDDAYAETEKVQQFLVENVARLKMRPVDRALLIQRARQQGEETSVIANRFGVSPSTVRRLLAQLDGATSSEVEALRAGDVSLSMHAVIARHVDPAERQAVLSIVSRTAIRTKELETLFVALGWQHLGDLGDKQIGERFALLNWACNALNDVPAGTQRERFRQLALKFPTALAKRGQSYEVVAQ
ncbi:ParB/RepB/Spo0J family partition protein [Terrabacter sp. RAF57]|uniref:ParB/RepB/Spo0J family partition protein n=1 Tax=Terrabacter sp. RAF57 TaxID=3233063 RepID=UPI003F946F18